MTELESGICAASEIVPRILSADFTGDYKEVMEGLVTVIDNHVKELTPGERIDVLNCLIDTYVERTGERPDGRMLYRLSNIVLIDQLSDKTGNKANNEYAFLSESQYYRRTRGIYARRNSEGTRYLEVPLSHASRHDINGLNYSLPVRSFINNDVWRTKK